MPNVLLAVITQMTCPFLKVPLSAHYSQVAGRPLGAHFLEGTLLKDVSIF